MAKTLVSSNILTNVAQAPYMAHCNMWYRMGRDSRDDFIFHAPNRNAIDVSRNQAARLALQSECDYLFMYDDDSIPHPGVYNSLKSADKDVIMALSFVRGYPYEPMMFKFDSSKIDKKTQIKSSVLNYYRSFADDIDKDGLVECDAIGFHCVLIKCELLKRMSYPYFVTYPGASTEDVYFCMKARRELKGELSIFVDTRVPAGHLLQPESVSYDTVGALRKRTAEEMPVQPYNEIVDHSSEEIKKWLESV